MIKEILSATSGIKSLTGVIKKAVSNHFCTVRLDGSSFCDEALGKIFSNIPMNTWSIHNSTKDEIKIEYNSMCAPSNITRMTIYRGVPIWLDIIKRQNKNMIVSDIYLRTINTEKNVAVLKHFIKRLHEKNTSRIKHEWGGNMWYYYDTHSALYNRFEELKLRTMDDVFIPEKDRELLTSTLDKFVNNKKWYDENNISYHLGILLYGEPGSGKSVLAQAISRYINANIGVLPGDLIMELPTMMNEGQIQSFTADKSLFNCILVEDIDCGFKKPDKKESKDKEDDDSREKGLASVLNCLDGLKAPINTVYIFTTNHIDQLDPALIRPGRCDLCLHVGYITNETFNQFCKFHYGKSCPEDLIVNDGLTFASLQIEVMKGKTFEELCEFVSKKEGEEK